MVAMRTVVFSLMLSLVARSLALATSCAASDTSRYSGFVIALAWPKAWAKQAGDGYDKLMTGLGFNDGGFYRVGHAALVLVSMKDSSCHYYDFGRYHTPVGYGLVRDEETDNDLRIQTKAHIDGRRIGNLDDFLCEIESNESTHASGPMYASYVRVNFDKAHEAAKQIQSRDFIPYGPFEDEGLNCSRFVREIILAGEPNWAHALHLEVVPTITPTTLYPVSALYHWVKLPACLNEEAEQLKEKLSSLPDSLFQKTLPEPAKPNSVPINAQWLAGESSGSWFGISKEPHGYLVSRSSMSGQVECEALMNTSEGSGWLLENEFSLIYPSHCAEITIRFYGETVSLKPIKRPGDN